MRSRVHKWIYKIHIYVGLFISLNLFLLAISGLILLFKSDFEDHENFSDNSAWMADVDQGLLLAKKTYPDLVPLAIFPDHNNRKILQIRLGAHSRVRLRDAKKLAYDVKEKSFITISERNSTFFSWVLSLHRELFLGLWGKFYIGLVGFMYVALLLTGFIIYGKFMKARIFGDVRNIFKLKLADLHKYFGVVSFGWALIVGFTGTLLAFNSIIIKVFQKLTLDKLAAKYNTSEALVGETVSFTQILSSIEKLGVNSSVSFVSFPGTEFGVSGRFVLLMESMWLGRAQASEVLVLGASGGNVQQVVDLPFYLKALVLSQPLHFGDFGGWPLKILWVAFTLMTLSTLLLGVGSYFSKRKLQQRNEKLIPIRKSIKVPPVYRLPFFLTASCLFGVLGCLLFQKVLFAVSLAALALPALVFLVKVRTRA